MQKEREAADLASLADDDLQTSLRAFKELPRAGGTHPQSRIEPRLTRVVSSFVYRTPDPTYTGVEVRCWSKREWPRVKKELRSYTGIGDFEGFAYRETKIEHLSASLRVAREAPLQGEPALEWPGCVLGHGLSRGSVARGSAPRRPGQVGGVHRVPRHSEHAHGRPVASTERLVCRLSR